ncbi:MAG: hypothetical protein H6Q42_2626, partial [Deltaproteobacteria bacterium]|nr:hypothetical protein [Deltaproteobacteria bacterium]
SRSRTAGVRAASSEMATGLLRSIFRGASRSLTSRAGSVPSSKRHAAIPPRRKPSSWRLGRSRNAQPCRRKCSAPTDPARSLTRSPSRPAAPRYLPPGTWFPGPSRSSRPWPRGGKRPSPSTDFYRGKPFAGAVPTGTGPVSRNFPSIDPAPWSGPGRFCRAFRWTGGISARRWKNRWIRKPEAERCLNCGRPGEFNQTCWYCLPCEIECPVEALEVRIPYLVR